jgi:hypothetical protein
MRATMASTESDSGSAAAHNRFCRQNVHPDPILILGVDGTSGVLDVADALGFIDVQQALMRASGSAIRQTRARPLAGEHCGALDRESC